MVPWPVLLVVRGLIEITDRGSCCEPYGVGVVGTYLELV